MKLTVRALAACALAAAISGCATPPPTEDAEATAAFRKINDPLEPLNRAILEFNLVLDKAVLKPVAYAYRQCVPAPLRENVRNFLSNLGSPVTFANDLMQGELDRAGTVMVRFAMNSSMGVFGINDVATEFGIPEHEEDFGQTLAIWSVGAGPYLMLPILGPTNLRDGVGMSVDSVIDPFPYLTSGEFRLGAAAGRAVDFRARNYDQLNELEERSLDFYAAVRSLYRQRRADMIWNGAPGDPDKPRVESDRLNPIRSWIMDLFK